MSSVALYTHADCLAHNPGEGHPESAVRFNHILNALRDPARIDPASIIWKQSALGTDEQVLYCHDQAYLDKLKAMTAELSADSPPVNVDPDTRISKDSLNAALRGVGGVCQAVDDIYDGTVKRAFCFSRPPGHHALKSNSMGFCLFGYAAIAAEHALTKADIKRVAILDFDVHKGNGTQNLVENNPNIQLYSIQEKGLWPFEDHDNDNGTCDNIRNFPVPRESDPQLYKDLFTQTILPDMARFAPDFIILSAGFDAHRDDPPKDDNLFNDPPGRQKLTEADFDWMTKQLMDLADKQAKGRFISILEGGYNPTILANCCVSHVKTLTS